MMPFKKNDVFQHLSSVPIAACIHNMFLHMLVNLVDAIVYRLVYPLTNVAVFVCCQPANVLLTRTSTNTRGFTSKLADFGLAKVW